MRAQRQQCGKEAQAEQLGAHPRAHPLPERHAGQAGASANSEAPATAVSSTPSWASTAARATVETVNDRPQACTSSSLSRPSACR